MQRDIASITAMLEHLHHNSRARVVPEISRAHNAAVHSRSTEGNQEPEVCLPARPGRRVVQLGAPALQISRSNHISAAFGVAYTEPHGATTLSNWTDVGPKVVGEPRYPIRNCDNLCSPTTKCLDYTLAPAPIFAQFLIAPWTKSNHSAAPWV